MRKGISIIILYMMALAAVLLSGMAFEIDKYSFLLQLFLLCAGGALSIKSVTRYPFSNIPTVIIFIVLTCMLIIVLNSGEEAFRCSYKMILFLVFIGSAKYSRRNKIDYLGILFNLFSTLAFVSFICYFLVHFCGFDSYTYSVTSHVNGFCGVYYYNKFPSIYINETPFYRFSGIFWEPGLYGCYASLALMYNLFFRTGKMKNFWTAVLFLSGIFTLSITAIGVSLFLMVYSFWINRRIKYEQRKIIGVCLTVGALIIAVAALWYKSQAHLTVANRGTGYNSWGVRWLDLTVGLRLMIQNLPFGIGYNNSLPFEELFKNIVGYKRPGSNGLINWLYQTGIPGLIYMILPFALLFRKRYNLNTGFVIKDKSKGVLFGLVCLTLIIINMSEPIFILPIMGIIMGYLYDKTIALNCGGLWTEKQLMFEDYYTAECTSSTDVEKEMQ